MIFSVISISWNRGNSKTEAVAAIIVLTSQIIAATVATIASTATTIVSTTAITITAVLVAITAAHSDYYCSTQRSLQQL